MTAGFGTARVDAARRLDLHPHAIAVHFTNALYPVAVLFLLASLLDYRREDSLFAYHHLMILATLSAPVAYATGILEWRRRYGGIWIRIFARKCFLGLLLLGLGAACALWYGLSPEVVSRPGALRGLFLLLNAAILPLVAYLGHLGGRLVFGGAH